MSHIQALVNTHLLTTHEDGIQMSHSQALVNTHLLTTHEDGHKHALMVLIDTKQEEQSHITSTHIQRTEENITFIFVSKKLSCDLGSGSRSPKPI